MKKQTAVLAALCLLSLTACKLPKTSYITLKATVLEVYEADDAGFKYRSYLIDRGGGKIVVPDPTARSHHKVGDTIEYMEQKIELPTGPKILSFNLLK